MEHLKYPIGKFEKPENITVADISNWMQDIKNFPHELYQLTNKLSPEQLQLTYRPGGWSVKQVVHHCADSHMNSLIRFKLALTEDTPTIRPYYEDRWAELTDGLDDNIEPALNILQGVHQKWVLLLQSLTEAQLELTFIHPEHGKHFSLKENIGIYAWHGKHHLAHIKLALERV